jgi:hypothetical protein
VIQVLNPHAELAVPAEFDLLAYRDTEDPALIYAVPTTPRWARKANGRAAVSLMVYLRKADRTAVGGQLIITLDLHLAREELEGLSQLARIPVAPGEVEPPPPKVIFPNWLDGRVRVELVDGVGAEGSPSMVGENSCSMAVEIGAEHIAEVLAAWEDGLPQARATYQVLVQSAVQASASARLRVEGRTMQHRRIVDHQVTAAESLATSTPLTITGPIRLTAAQRVAARTDVEL